MGSLCGRFHQTKDVYKSNRFLRKVSTFLPFYLKKSAKDQESPRSTPDETRHVLARSTGGDASVETGEHERYGPGLLS